MREHTRIIIMNSKSNKSLSSTQTNEEEIILTSYYGLVVDVDKRMST